jgi:hypothetical protein
MVRRDYIIPCLVKNADTPSEACRARKYVSEVSLMIYDHDTDAMIESNAIDRLLDSEFRTFRLKMCVHIVPIWAWSVSILHYSIGLTAEVMQI